MTTSLSYAILGATYALGAAAQPGQFQAYVVARAIAHGWRRTLPSALAPILSDVFVVSLVLAVLTRIPPVLLLVLRLTGGFFLLYLSWNAFRSLGTPDTLEAAPSVPAQRTLLEAAFVNVLNPNPYLAWALVLGPLLLEAWTARPAYGIALVASFYLTIVVATAGIIILAASVRSLGSRMTRALGALSAVALLGFGIYQLVVAAVALFAPGTPRG